MDKYYILTYGCQMNEHDSENMAKMLIEEGYEKAENPNEANLILINTCSVRENADKRFFGVLGQFKKRKQEDKDFIIVVAGCMPQQPHIIEKIEKQFNWVDIIIGTQTINELPGLISKVKAGKKHAKSIVDDAEEVTEMTLGERKHSHKALVNITYGCNNFCTYCIVPYTRGREKSRDKYKIIEEIKALADDGVKEVMLLGQNVNSYKDKNNNGLPDLIKEIDKIDGISRIRFMTSHPKDISDELIECFGSVEHLCKQIHLPVQSGSNDILQKMNRRYTIEDYLKVINKLRKISPEIAISTDIIVGFPGETDDDFLKTMNLVSEVRYDSAFTFLYSKRRGTPAAIFGNQINEDIKHKRFDKLKKLVDDISFEKNQKYKGKTVKVLVDGLSEKKSNTLAGRTDDFKLVNFFGKSNKIGDFAEVEITECKTFSLFGKEIF